MKYRIEKDALGEKIIPSEAYYGIHSLRSKETFEITKNGLCRQNIKALATIKKVFAKVNCEYNFLDEKKCEAIMLSCDEILNGRLHGQFIIDSIHDGYGYGMNMNVCEVVANRANEMLGGSKGQYEKVTLEDVDLNQDTDEIVVLAGKITAVRLVKKLITEGKKLVNSLDDVINNKLNDSLKEQFVCIMDLLDNDLKKLNKAIGELLEISEGRNILHLDDDSEYWKKIVKNINTISSDKFVLGSKTYNSISSLNPFIIVSSQIKNMMVNLSKGASDLKEMVNNKQIIVPSSGYMDSKGADTSCLDVVKQISFYIIGNDITISRCVEDSKLNDNCLKTMIFACLFESANLVRRTLRTLREQFIEIIEVK